MTNYQRGRAFEYEVRDLLGKQGFYVFRVAGSFSPFDLVAVRKDIVLFVQCKYNTGISKKELEDIKEFMRKYTIHNSKCMVLKRKKGSKDIEVKVVEI